MVCWRSKKGELIKWPLFFNLLEFSAGPLW